PETRPPLFGQAILGVHVPAPCALTDGIAEHVGPASSIDGIGFADVMQQLPRDRQTLPYATSQRIPAIPEIHSDKPPLEPPAVRDVFRISRLGILAADLAVVVVYAI